MFLLESEKTFVAAHHRFQSKDDVTLGLQYILTMRKHSVRTNANPLNSSRNLGARRT